MIYQSRDVGISYDEMERNEGDYHNLGSGYSSAADRQGQSTDGVVEDTGRGSERK